MANATQVEWGRWLQARFRHLGFRRSVDVARAVGCRPEQFSRWCNMAEPPQQMLKGFDSALAHVLKTDRYTLFTAFRSIAPEAAPIVARRRITAEVA